MSVENPDFGFCEKERRMHTLMDFEDAKSFFKAFFSRCKHCKKQIKVHGGK